MPMKLKYFRMAILLAGIMLGSGVVLADNSHCVIEPEMNLFFCDVLDQPESADSVALHLFNNYQFDGVAKVYAEVPELNYTSVLENRIHGSSDLIMLVPLHFLQELPMEDIEDGCFHRLHLRVTLELDNGGVDVAAEEVLFFRQDYKSGSMSVSSDYAQDALCGQVLWFESPEKLNEALME